MAFFHVSSHLPVHHRLSLRSISSFITENHWCLYICFLSFSVIMSAPIKDSPYWINPCGLEVEVDGIPPISLQKLLDLLEDVIRNADASNKQIVEAKADLLSASGLTEEDMERYRYNWLPETPENDVHYFRKLNRNEAVKSTFHMLQTYAVAFEQMLEELESSGEAFGSKAKLIKERSVQLLCTVQLAMVGLKITPPDAPTRSVMPDEFKNLPYSRQLLRNYIIAREYVKVTMYVKEVFKYFASNLEN